LLAIKYELRDRLDFPWRLGLFKAVQYSRQFRVLLSNSLFLRNVGSDKCDGGADTNSDTYTNSDAYTDAYTDSDSEHSSVQRIEFPCWGECR
jgi:hypothetical protein